MVVYRWYLTYVTGNSAENRTVYPIWKDDLAKEWAFEQGQQFRRAQLSGSISFFGGDYDWIMGKPFGSKFEITLQAKWDSVAIYHTYWTGVFYHTDCTINTDDRMLSVKPNTDDKYTKILAGIDREYDLIKLKTRTQYAVMFRRPLLQIYTLGDSNVSCFLGGMSWQQEVTSDSYSESTIMNTYHFGKVGALVQVTFQSPPAGLEEGFIGSFSGGSTPGAWADFSNEANVYYMDYFQQYEEDAYYSYYTNGLRIYRTGSSMTPENVIWYFSQTNTTTSPTDTYLPIPNTFTMTAMQQGYSNLSASWTGTTIFGRWIVGEQLIGSEQIPASDLVAYNRNYRYCIPFEGQGYIRTTSRGSTTPTEWGTKPNGEFYTKPTLNWSEQTSVWAIFPVARTDWQNWSIWLLWRNELEAFEMNNRAIVTLRDAYTLNEVISTLLAQIDSSLSFNASATYSQFLYGDNPLTLYWGSLMITPKSNVKVAEYTQPAQKAPLTLNEVLTMLKNAFGLYWFIDSANRFRIEHISWFKNGGSYTASQQTVGYDLTALTNTRNGKKWSFATGTYSYDKMQMPERYEYQWADTTTNIFKGSPIEVLSQWVEQGRIEEVNIAKFNPDIDYIMLNPSDISDDGFALLCCDQSYTVTFRAMNVNGERVAVQNFQLAMYKVQEEFLISDMPSWNIKVNGVAITAKGIQRMKKQQVEAPYVQPNLDMGNLVKTTLGNGEVERASIRLTSRMCKFNLRYDTSQQ